MFFVTGMTAMLILYVYHCVWVTSEAYSSPSIVLSARAHDGSQVIFDDFREAYYWLRRNTPPVRQFRLFFAHNSQISFQIAKKNLFPAKFFQKSTY